MVYASTNEYLRIFFVAEIEWSLVLTDVIGSQKCWKRPELEINACEEGWTYWKVISMAVLGCIVISKSSRPMDKFN